MFSVVGEYTRVKVDRMNRAEPVHCAWSDETVLEEWAAPYESHVPLRALVTGRPQVSTNGSLDIIRQQILPLTRVCTWKRKRGGFFPFTETTPSLALRAGQDSRRGYNPNFSLLTSHSAFRTPNSEFRIRQSLGVDEPRPLRWR
jgi:hypothetical protein